MRRFLLCALLAVPACADLPNELATDQAPPTVAVMALACRVDVADGQARCNSGPVGTGASLGMATAAALASAPSIPGPVRPGMHIDLGGQGNTVGVALLDVGLSGDSLLVTTVELTNRLDQPLGMATVTTPDVNRVRLGIVDGPVALGGGTVSVLDPDGLAFFTAADQPFARFNAPIQPNQRAWRDLRFRLTGAVSSFTFRAIVRAALPDESPSRATGEPVRFASVELSPSNGGCAVTAGSQMTYCWGDNSFGRVGNGRGSVIVPGPAGHSRFVRLTPTQTGGVCGTRIDGRIFCWGAVPFNVATTPISEFGVRRVFPGIAARDVAIGDTFGCALDTRNEAWCAGANSDGEAGNGAFSDVASVGRVVGGLTFRSLAAGTNFACGISQARAVFCWGRNAEGQLGDGSTASRAVPTRVRAIADSVVQIVAARRVACARTQTLDVWCWGDNGNGAVGIGVIAGPPVVQPERVITGGVAELAAGGDHVCARRTDGSVECWGGNTSGQTGTSPGADVPSPTPIAAPTAYVADSLVAGGDVTCFRQAGAWTCFGANSEGQAGVEPAGILSLPTLATGLTGLRSLALGLFGGCGLTATDELWCWGSNGAFVFPDDPQTSATSPSGIFGGRVFAEVDVGTEGACGRRPAGGTYCWGVRHPGSTFSTVPETLTTGIAFSRISVGFRHACGLSQTDGSAWCWGDNQFGELGVTGAGSATPVQVTGAQRFVEIRAGQQYTCARDADGFVWCWGLNSVGQLGRGTTNVGVNAVPQRAGSLQFTSLTVGPATACGITAAREAICWGSNGGDVLGLGPAIPFAASPTFSIGTLQVQQLSIGGNPPTGFSFGCGVSPAGEVYCGGAGPLGTTTFETGSFRRVPMPVPAVSVSAGFNGACALDTAGRLWCWGFVGLGTFTGPPALVTLR